MGRPVSGLAITGAKLIAARAAASWAERPDRALRVPDFSAAWPSSHWGGQVWLQLGGCYATPHGAGKLQAGESVIIDQLWPLHAEWTGVSWRYHDGQGFQAQAELA